MCSCVLMYAQMNVIFAKGHADLHDTKLYVGMKDFTLAATAGSRA